MTDAEILDKVAGIVAAQFALDKAEVTTATSPEEIEAWDSLTHVALTRELESAFDTSFEIEEIMEMEDVGAMARLIARKLA